MKRIAEATLIMTAFTMSACQSTGSTSSQSTEDSTGREAEVQVAQPVSNGAESSGKTTAPADSIWIAMPDGSKQCESNTGRPLEEDARKLTKAGIKVLKSSKGNDGMMHIALCGAATGQINAYLIPASDRDRALKAGFIPFPSDAVLKKRTEF